MSPTEIGEGFVEEDELRRAGQCAGDLHAAALAAGQAHAEVVADVVDVELLQQAFQGLLAAVAVEVGAGLEDGADVVRHRQLAEDRGFLRQVADAGAGAAVHGQVGDVLLVDADHALVGADQADDHVEAGGLAGAVGAEQADDLPAVDAHADVADDLAALVALGEVLCGERGHYWA